MSDVSANRAVAPDPNLRFGSPAARWVVAATVAGSGIAFLDSTVVNVALPHISDDLGGGMAGLQWTLDAYLVTLTSLLLLGGSLGDLYGRRRIFVLGLAGFGAASLLCGLAPTIEVLIAARALQGVAGALLVPSSLAIISASFHPDDRARAVGAWSGLGAAAGAVGPFVGGWLVDAVSWRPVFFINFPIAAATIAIAVRHVPETSEGETAPSPDLRGAALITVALAATTYGLIEMGDGVTVSVATALVVGVVSFVGFLFVESRHPHPLLPLSLFRSAQFTGANLVTLTVYAGLGVTSFLVTVQLQIGLGYSALEAGAALLPVTIIAASLSARAGALAQHIGPRLPMTVGSLTVAAGLLLYTRIEPGRSYVEAVLPGAVVFGLGVTALVAPLTATVLGSVSSHQAGIASGVNNAVARLAGLLAVAVLPGLAGITAAEEGLGFGSGFATALQIAAGLCAAGAVIAFATIRTAAPARPVSQPLAVSCLDPCVAEEAGRAA
jgi:EmrB/QacA subfamily drug resistance transporter